MDKKTMLEQLINYYANGNKTHFSKLLGVTPQGVSTWLSRGTIDYELVYSKCDGLNAHWLLTGEGSMLCNEQTHATPVSTTQITQPALPVEESFIYKMYKEKDEENKILIERIGALKERFRQLEVIQETTQSIDQQKQSEPRALIEESPDAFTQDSFGASGKDVAHMRKPTSSRASSGSKI